MNDRIPFLHFGCIFGCLIIIYNKSIAIRMQPELTKHMLYDITINQFRILVILFGLLTIGFGVGVYLLD